MSFGFACSEVGLLLTTVIAKLILYLVIFFLHKMKISSFSPSGMSQEDAEDLDRPSVEDRSSTMTSLSEDIVEHMNNIGLGTLKLASSMDKINDISESQSESGFVRNAPLRRSSYEYKSSEFNQQSRRNKSPIFGLRSRESRGSAKGKQEKKKASVSTVESTTRKSISAFLRRSNSGRPLDEQDQDKK